jgi:hypothetical protein
MNGATPKSYHTLPRVSDVGWKVMDAADFDGDGKADMLWWNSTTGDVNLWLMNGGTVKSYHSVGRVSDTNWKVQN